MKDTPPTTTDSVDMQRPAGVNTMDLGAQSEKGGVIAAGQERGSVSGVRLFALLASVTLAAILMLLDGSIIGVASPNITTQFHSIHDVGWYTAAYQLASAALQPMSGKIYTYYNARWTYLTFFALFELGSLICGVANSSSTLIGGRALAGIGSSGLLNGGMTIIAGAVPLEKRPGEGRTRRTHRDG